MTLWNALLDLLFPPRCQVCGEAGSFPLCLRCLVSFPVIRPPVCQRCGRPLQGPPDLIFTCIPCRGAKSAVDLVRAYGIYEGSLREAIHALKFRRRKALARPLGALMADLTASWPSAFTADGVVPVPLHRRRLRERGFNQAHLLAEAVSARAGIPLLPHALRRTRATPAQAGLLREARLVNVQGAFLSDPEVVEGRCILLVDDVLTTGATVEACALALKSAGAKKVAALVLARSLLE